MQADFALDYDVLTVERPQTLYLMARFVASAGNGEGIRRPLNLSLAIDRSGSMAGAKLDYTRQAAQFLVQHLGTTDLFSIVLYNDKVETLFAPQAVTNKDQLMQQIATIKATGTTNLSGGWLEACQHIKTHFSAETLNRVIVMSDGLANRGITDRGQLVGIVRQKYEEGISTTTMGLGSDFNEDLMIEMADAGGGAYYFIESPEVAPEIFREELSGLLNLVGQNLIVTVSPTSHVKGVRQLNSYSFTTNGLGSSFRLGDVLADEHKTLMLELSIPALATLGEQQIATLSFEYDDLTGVQVVHRVSELAVMVRVRPATELPQPPDVKVTQNVLLLQAARARQEAVKSSDNGDYVGASQILRSAAEVIQSSLVTNVQLEEERAALIEQANQIVLGPPGDYERKTMSSQAYYTMRDRHQDTVLLRRREISRQDAQPDELAVVPPMPDKFSTMQSVPIITIQADRQADGHAGAAPIENIDPPTQFQWHGRFFTLTGDIMRIGRAIHNEIVIDEKGVSRFHSQIRRDGQYWYIEDLGSTNGTMVGGERIAGAYRLRVGDTVYLCDEKLVFS